MDNSLLALERITKKFADVTAVENLTITLKPGDIYAMIGPNGSGKTTTVKTATGIYRPTSGTVRIGGIDLAAEPERAKALAGFVPDEPFVYERLTGREFLHLVGSLYGMSPAERNARIKDILGLFPVEAIIDSSVDNYSRGNKQKLSILAALLHRPKVLLADEPIVGLDPDSIIAARNIFSTFAADGGAVFLCTHTLSFAESVATRVGLLSRGRLIREGTIRELREIAKKPSATLEELYLQFTHAA